jgi:hypothetical protein
VLDLVHAADGAPAPDAFSSSTGNHRNELKTSEGEGIRMLPSFRWPLTGSVWKGIVTKGISRKGFSLLLPYHATAGMVLAAQINVW